MDRVVFKAPNSACTGWSPPVHESQRVAFVVKENVLFQSSEVGLFSSDAVVSQPGEVASLFDEFRDAARLQNPDNPARRPM